MTDINMTTLDPNSTTFRFSKEPTINSCGFEQLILFLKTCDRFVEEFLEFGMTELHPVLYVDGETIIVELEFIEDSECKHDREKCINAFNSTFAIFHPN